ncbi:OmpW/AlkL family protein [Croceicoccus hydrothermalis]|uniref:OmpW/AlkL family protein n=1 Tax=Croceicoccus hydrothermalis TaxID=2867964 RepID=UPI001EFB54E4|nr:OmpW family outer membrane protein [Croceicoccus hydrothermalis]
MKLPVAHGMAAIAALALPLAAATPALAQMQAPDRAGSVQIRGFVTGVLPDAAIIDVETDIVGLPAGTQTEANDNVVPTVGIEYFVTSAISLETICCLTQHDVDGTTGLPGAELVSDAKLVPATLTAKYHFDLGGAKPYVGAGPAYFIFIDEKPGAATLPLGVTDFHLSDELGFALQAGVDLPVNDAGLMVSLDAKRYFIDTTASWYAGDTLAIRTEHTLDPWVVSAGMGLRF